MGLEGIRRWWIGVVWIVLLGAVAVCASNPELEPDLDLDTPQGVTNITEKYCEGKAKSFLLGFIGHSGSTALMSILQQHPQLKVPFPYEPLLPTTGDADGSVARAQTIFDLNLQRYPDKATGFKVRPGNIKYGEASWTNLVTKYETRLVLNFRDNLFKTAIGLYSIRVRGDLSSQQGLLNESPEEHCAFHPDLCKFEITNYASFAYMLAKAYITRESTKSIASMVDWPCILVTQYENFEKDSDAEVARIQDYLGVERHHDEAQYQKALPDDPCKLLLNYQEVCHLFWKCPLYREYLEDEQYGCVCESPPDEDFDADLCDPVKAVKNGEKELCEYETPAGSWRKVACDSQQYLDYDAQKKKS